MSMPKETEGLDKMIENLKEVIRFLELIKNGREYKETSKKLKQELQELKCQQELV